MSFVLRCIGTTKYQPPFFLRLAFDEALKYGFMSNGRDPTVRSKLMALSNRYSSLALPDLHLTEYVFDIHSMDNGIRKLK